MVLSQCPGFLEDCIPSIMFLNLFLAIQDDIEKSERTFIPSLIFLSFILFHVSEPQYKNWCLDVSSVYFGATILSIFPDLTESNVFKKNVCQEIGYLNFLIFKNSLSRNN